MKCKDYALRRRKLMDKMGPDSIAIFIAAKETLRTGSSAHSYRQDSDFYYLTGFDEQESALVLIPGRPEGEFILFSRAHDPDFELWHGKCAGQKVACSDYCADEAHSITLFDSLLFQLLQGKQKVYFKIGFDSNFDMRIMRLITSLREGCRAGVQVPYEFLDVTKILHEMRLYKSDEEILLMRKAAEITVAAHLSAMRACVPEIYEYELEAELLYEFNRLGGRSLAFESIVGGGANACTLHYCKNNEKLTAGELVLLDAGVEYEYYAADITRTYPVNGKFTKEQREIYAAVLDTQLKVIAIIKPGISWDKLQIKAEEVITEHLVRLGLLPGSVKENLEKKNFKKFFMHRIGHWLGMDCHDVGEYKPKNEWRILEPGMIFTVEPGIYISSGLNVGPEWKNIGVRIEDNILVTAEGCEVLTKKLPKNIEEIESLIQKK